MTQSTPQYILQSWPTARQWDRAPLNAPLTVTVGSTRYHGWCQNVSAGGLGFTCAAPIKTGDEISLCVTLESGGHLEARGIVRHSAAFRSGCEFMFISPRDQQQIEHYVRHSAAKSCR